MTSRYFLSLCLINVILPGIPTVSGQDSLQTKGSRGIRVAGGYGFVMAHRPALAPLQEAHVKALELSFQVPTSGTHSWESNFNFPEKGITLAIFDLGSPRQLGKGVALYPYYDFPLSTKKEWGLYLRFGAGLGYIEKVFDVSDNIKNYAISSHINGVMHFNFHLRKSMGTCTVAEGGIGLTHFSNGSIQIPNLGINVPCVNLGIIHYMGPKKTIRSAGQPSVRERSENTISIGMATKRILPPLGRYYTAGSLTYQHLRTLSAKSMWGLGADLFYDQSLEERISRDTVLQARSADNFRPGIHGVYQLNTGPLGLQFNFGFYPYTKYKGDGLFYERICIRYYLQHLFFAVNLKAHYAKADFVEGGLGWRFGKNPSKTDLR